MPDRSSSEKPGRTPGTVHVWDLFLRVFHWTLAATFFVAYFTEDELLAIHVWAGYLIGGLIVLRLVWGLVGPRHARFSDFVTTPVAAWRYFIALIAMRSRRHLGHSPAGGMMVLALLAGLAFTVWSGMETYAAEEGRGPLAATRSAPTIQAETGPLILVSDGDKTERDGQHDRNTDSIWEDVHETMANFVFLLVLLHLCGVLIASLAHRENLVRAMITGDKRGN